MQIVHWVNGRRYKGHWIYQAKDESVWSVHWAGCAGPSYHFFTLKACKALITQKVGW